MTFEQLLGIFGGNAALLALLYFLLRSLFETKLREQHARFEHELGKERDANKQRAAEKHDFVMVALEKRLDKHQEAYSMFDRLYRVLHDNDKGTIVKECYDWWRDNNLYLSEPARTMFRAGIHDVFSYNDYKGTEEMMPAYKRIMAVFQAVETALGLPHIDPKPRPEPNGK